MFIFFNKLQKKLFLLMVIIFNLIALTSCTTITSTPNPKTHRYQTNRVLDPSHIEQSKSVDLHQYKIVLVKSNSEPNINSYIADSLQKLQIFKEVKTVDSIANLLSAKSNSDELGDTFSTNYGLKKFSQIYGKILILNFHQSTTSALQINYNFNLYDPSDDKTYFAAHFSSYIGLAQVDLPQFFNALADWANTRNSK